MKKSPGQANLGGQSEGGGTGSAGENARLLGKDRLCDLTSRWKKKKKKKRQWSLQDSRGREPVYGGLEEKTRPVRKGLSFGAAT